MSEPGHQPNCQRVREAEANGTLAAVLDELSTDPSPLAACATCSAALARYRKLADGLAQLGASARRRPDHVARALAAEAATAAPVTPLRPRRRAAAVLAPLIALAAALALVWWLRRSPTTPTDPSQPADPPVRFAFQIVKQGGPALRGEAQLGDQLRLTLPAGSALWLYRNDRELLLICPRDCRRQGNALTAARTLDTLGQYQLVWISTDQVPAPSGEVQADITAARAAGASYLLREVDVE